MDTFELSSAIEGLFGSPPGTKQIMAIVAAAGTKTNTLDLSQFSRLAHRFSKGEFGDPSGQANDTVLEDGFYEHEFKKLSVGFRVKNVLETGSIVVSKVNDPDLEGLVEVGDTVIAVNGAPLGWVKRPEVLGEKVKELPRPVRISFTHGIDLTDDKISKVTPPSTLHPPPLF